MTCHDCIHNDVCIGGCENAEDCDRFKDKSKMVELPCKVGDIVYQTDGVRLYSSTVTKILFDSAGILCFDENAIGKSVFLTREEAQRHKDMEVEE